MKKLNLISAALLAFFGTLTTNSVRADLGYLPMGLFLPGTMSISFKGVGELAYEYKAPVFQMLAEAALRLNGDQPEFESFNPKPSPGWFMVPLAEPMIRDVQSQVFATRVIPKLETAQARMRDKHHLVSLDQFPIHSAYQAAAMRGLAAALRASYSFLADPADQAFAQSLLSDTGRAIARLDAGEALSEEFKAKLRDDGARRLVESLAQHPRTRGMGGMAARAVGYLVRQK
jgi:hypothetical protein